MNNNGQNRVRDPFAIEQEEWKNRQIKNRLKQMLTISSPIFILILWEFLSRTGLVDARFFPPPTEIVGTFLFMGTSGELFDHIGISLFRIFAGFPRAVDGALFSFEAFLFSIDHGADANSDVSIIADHSHFVRCR
jgi:hypothetical protein